MSNTTLFILCFVGHQIASLMMHSLFLHRYGTHQQFTMSIFWERVFFVVTWLLQGPSFLNPKTYAILHLLHHTHSDDKNDPHSPKNFSKSLHGWDIATALPKMMYATKKTFAQIKKDLLSEVVSANSEVRELVRTRKFPEWRTFEKFADSKVVMLGMALIMFFIYLIYAPSWWLWFLLPFTILNGPSQGAIVNWFGHMWGYVNFRLPKPDNSKNTPILGTIMLGECYQNNHHKDPMNPNFGFARWYEFDPLYPVVLILDKIGIIQLPKNV